MGKTKKYIKIRLKGGDTLKEIISFVKNSKEEIILFFLDSNFNAIVHEDFLKKLKKAKYDNKKKLIFITHKKYFQQILKSKNFEVNSYEPEEFQELEAKTLSEYMGGITASKNILDKNIKEKENVNDEEQGNKNEDDLELKNNTSSLRLDKKKESKKTKFSTKKIESSIKEKSFRGVVFFLLLFMILGLGSIYLLISPKAVITIKPKISTVETTQNILVTLANNKIPKTEITLPTVSGILVETEIEDTEIFPSTGRNYEVTNAHGKVRLYNETSQPKYILPSRLSTKSGIIVRMKNSTTIPPRRDGKAGFIDVEVVADKFKEDGKPIGSLGNLDPDTNLFFPALLPKTRTYFYAKTKLGPLVGGSTLTKYFIAPTDFENATKLLEETFAIRATEKLKNELAARSKREQKHYIFIEHNQNLLKKELLSAQYDKELIGTPTETLSIKAKMKISGLVFDQDDVLEIMKKQLEGIQDHRKEILRIDPFSVEYQVMKTDEFQENNWTKISVSVTGIEALSFNKENIHAQKWVKELKSEMLGKTISHARSILLNRSEIEKIIEIKVSPFWTKVLPLLHDQIKLEVSYGK